MYNCNGNRRVKVALKITEDCLHQKCQIQEYQNRNWLSVCRILSLQLKPEVGRTKPLTGPRVGHSWSKVFERLVHKHLYS